MTRAPTFPRRPVVSGVVALVLVLFLLPSGVHGTDLDADMPLLHGSRLYAHLDCSACLTVAGVLGDRMNTSLKESSPSILVSHRLEKNLGDRRIPYRGSELRAIEIMENGCNQPLYMENVLRLNAQTKVRGYHIVLQETMLDANRPDLLEGTTYPADEVQNFEHNALRVPVAKRYTRSEQDAFRERAPEVLCSFLMEEREEDVSAIIRHAQYLTEVEANLCGYTHGWQPPASAEGETPWEGLSSPALHVCADTEAVAASAKRDQLRWSRSNQRAAAAHKVTAEPAAAGSDAHDHEDDL